MGLIVRQSSARAQQHANLESESEYLKYRFGEEHSGESHVEIGQRVAVHLVGLVFISRVKLDATECRRHNHHSALIS